MLGFDAIGRQALGQITSLRTFTLTASAYAFVLSGQAALFQTNMVSIKATYTLTGMDSIPVMLGTASTGTFTVAGKDAVLTRNTLWTEAAQQNEVWTEKIYGS